jgi:hypothetical protein
MSGAVSEPVDSTRKLAQMSRTAKPVTQHVVGRQHPGTLHQRGPVADHRQDTRSSAAATTRNFFNEPGTGARLIPVGRHGDPATSPAHFLFKRISPMEEKGSGGKGVQRKREEKGSGKRGQSHFAAVGGDGGWSEVLGLGGRQRRAGWRGGSACQPARRLGFSRRGAPAQAL